MLVFLEFFGKRKCNWVLILNSGKKLSDPLMWRGFEFYMKDEFLHWEKQEKIGVLCEIATFHVSSFLVEREWWRKDKVCKIYILKITLKTWRIRYISAEWTNFTVIIYLFLTTKIIGKVEKKTNGICVVASVPFKVTKVKALQSQIKHFII